MATSHIPHLPPPWVGAPEGGPRAKLGENATALALQQEVVALRVLLKEKEEELAREVDRWSRPGSGAWPAWSVDGFLVGWRSSRRYPFYGITQVCGHAWGMGNVMLHPAKSDVVGKWSPEFIETITHLRRFLRYAHIMQFRFVKIAVPPRKSLTPGSNDNRCWRSDSFLGRDDLLCCPTGPVCLT